MCHRYSAITFVFATDSTCWIRGARRARLRAGPNAIAMPVWAHANASIASDGGDEFWMVWPATEIIDTGNGPTPTSRPSATAETTASSTARRPVSNPPCQAMPN